MKKLLLLVFLLCAGSAMAQQQNFKYSCDPSNSGVTPISVVGGGNCTFVATPNVNTDYPVSSTTFDDISIINDGHIFALRVRAVLNSGVATCSDDDDAVRVHDGDRVGAYYNGITGALVVYINTTATALRCSIPGVIWPGNVPSQMQVQFFKK